MTPRAKILLVVLLATVIVAVLVLDQTASKPQTQTSSISELGKKAPSGALPSPPRATGKVEDLVQAVLGASIVEESIVTQEEEQESLLFESDRREINELGTAYEDSDF